MIILLWFAIKGLITDHLLDMYISCMLFTAMVRVQQSHTKVTERYFVLIFSYYASPPDDIYVGTFNWKLYFAWERVSDEQLKKRKASTDPIA